MSIALKERIYAVYDAFSAGKFEALFEMFDERVDFESNAPIEVFPYLGRLIGRAAVMKALQAVHGRVRLRSSSFLADHHRQPFGRGYRFVS